MTQTDKDLVEAIKEEFPPKEKKEKKKPIKFGKLRERVKRGDLDPREVLSWYKEQPEQWSKSLVTFLKNQMLLQGKRKQEKDKKKEEKGKDNKQKSKKGHRRKRGRKTNQSRRTGETHSSKSGTSTSSEKGGSQKDG